MIIHYLKTAWRNLLKYKTQNTISVLSLAVGTVCFAITLYIMKSVILDIYLNEIDTRIATFHAYKMSEEQYKNRKTLDENFADIQLGDEEWVDYNFFKRVSESELPSLREWHFMSMYMGKDTEYETKDGGKKILLTHYAMCSPRFFHYQYYNSAVSGERIPELKEGDVLITADIRDKVYGKGADPRGLTIDGKRLTISDVLDTSDHLDDSFSGIFIVGELPAEHYRTIGLRFELKPGATAAQLHKELSSAIPEYYFTYTVNDFDWSDEGIIFVVFVFAVLFLGCSVLLIAVMGYLKMQLQLFSLRSRELALRRTMGARVGQLIMQLAVEIVIVFLFAAIASFVVTALLADYALPIIYKIHGGIVFNLDAIYGISARVIGCTMLVTLLVASAVIYRQLRRPVGLRVGRSGHPRTVGQSIMISVQLAVSMFLILAVLGLFYLINDTYQEQADVLPDNPSRYRRALVMSGNGAPYYDVLQQQLAEFKDKLMQTGTVEHASVAFIKPTRSTTLDSELLTHYIERTDDSGNVNDYEYSYTVTEEEIFELLGIEITPERPTENLRHTTAVYVPTEEVERLRLKWGLKPSPDTRVKRPLGSRSYTLIGYAKALQHYSYNAYNDYTPAFWIVDDDADIGEGYNTFDFIIFPKDGEYGNCEAAIEKIYREAHPESVNDVPVNCLYDAWFTQMVIMEMFIKLAMLLVFVSILSIVASVYSSISLESRGRQKEVALRKVHGAKSRDIMRLFASYYIRLLAVAAAFVAAVWLLLSVVLHCFVNSFVLTEWIEILCYLAGSVFIVSMVTLATIAHKIYRVSKINAAEVIKKD